MLYVILLYISTHTELLVREQLLLMLIGLVESMHMRPNFFVQNSVKLERGGKANIQRYGKLSLRAANEFPNPRL